MHSKVPLQGVELEAYLQKEQEAKDKEAAQQAALARNRMMLEADEDDSDTDESDSDDEEEVRASLQDDPMGGERRKNRGADRIDWTDGDEGLTKQLLSFDIYLKGNVQKATSFFKTTGGTTNRFRMFPYVERKRRVDDYGETIDVGMWLRKGKVLEEEAETEEIRDYKKKQAEADDKVTTRYKGQKRCSQNIDQS